MQTILTSVVLVLLFFSVCTAFGFAFLNKITKIKSLIYLASFSLTFGICSYVFLCHLLSFFFAPKNSSVYSLITLIILSILIFITQRNKDTKPISEISSSQLTTILLFSVFISTCIFFSAYRYGMFDEGWHIPLAKSIFHNDIYPPRDFFRPDYTLIYHFGGDLLSGAVSHLCRTNILTSFELVSGVLSGITFLSFFSLAWLLSKNYFLSFLSAICCFFGAGLTWLNALIGYLIKHGNFLDSFLGGGIQGIVVDAPSHLSFTSTSSIGHPVLILCLFLFWNLIQEDKSQTSKSLIASLLVSLFSLSLFAGWLSMTFLVSSGVFTLILIVTKKEPCINILIFFLLFFILTRLIGNQMYSPDQFLGRANIFNIALKERPFTITIWNVATLTNELTTVISCFSWKFLSSFGLSLFLFPVALIYLIKQKNQLAYLLFLCAALTMPLPVLFEFKLNPVDFNRLFRFGNTMLILLITCGFEALFPSFVKKKTFLAVYILLFCLSPIAGFISGVLFSPQIYLHPKFRESTFQKLKNIYSVDDLFTKYLEVNQDALKAKYSCLTKYKKEIEFFSKNGMSGDVAVSSLPGIPVNSGVYTLVPSMTYGLKGQIYSSFDNIYPTIISTLDPHLLKELNVKWVGYDEAAKSKLMEETRGFLTNSMLFKLFYTNYITPEENQKVLYEVYHVEDLTEYLKNKERKTGWILVNKDGFPLEITEKLNNNISLFQNEKETLTYLKQLHKSYPKLKKELITAQPIIIKTTEEQLKQSGLNIKLEKKF